MNLKAAEVSPEQPVQLPTLQTELSAAPTSSWYQCSAAVVGHLIYLSGSFGPHTANGKICTIVPILDTVKNAWRWLPCEGPSCKHVSIAVYEDSLYWLGEQAWEENGRAGVSRFDLNLEEWQLCQLNGEGPGPRRGCSMHVHERRKQLVFFGGKVVDTKQNDIHLLDLRLNRWVDVVVKGEIPVARWEHSSWINGDKLYCFGGWTNRGSLPRDGLYVLHFGKNNTVMWSNVKEASALGSFASSVAIPWKDSILIFCGSKSTNAHAASIWRSDGCTLDALAIGEDLPISTSATEAVKLNSEIFMFGSFSDEKYIRIFLEPSP